MSSIREKLAKKTSKLAHPREDAEGHPADLNNFQDGGFYQVEVESILPNPDQPRKYFDEGKLSELSESLKQKGVLQPVLIRRAEDGQIFLVAGERRLRAAKMAGLEKIPAILTKGNPAEIALIENLQRENLSAIDEAEALAKIINDHGYTQDQMASVVGKAKSTISETLSLNKLPESIRDEVRRAEQYPRRLLVEIAKQENPEAMIDLFNQVKEGSLKSDQVRKIARKQERTERAPAMVALDFIQSLQKRLGKIDLNSFAEADRVQIIAALQELDLSIKEIIS